MALQSGQSLLHYRLTGKIGEGGMGVVWTAQDSSLDREVAIKVLPDVFSEDSERLARFEREARLLASLNHPNIAAVYGLHQAEGVRFIAMELVDGEDLAQRLGRGTLALDDALEVALQIARALEAAHGNSVVHRDLKPANVLRGTDGRVKVLDFGLAKAVERDPASGAGSASLSPTVTSAGTVAGTLLGTAAYMSPEQARGRPVDRRTDIWAFGCLLYESLTGQKAFGGESVSDSLAAVLKSEPDWSLLPAATPTAVRRLLRRCLVKDPDGRLHDIADARLEIEEARNGPAGMDEPGAAGAPPTVGMFRRLLPWVVALMAVLVAVGFAVMAPDGSVPAPPMTQVVSSLLPPPDVGFELSHGFAVSPDGSQVVFAARDENGTGGLWTRPLDRAEARPLVGTDGGLAPFWSPDGRHLGFFAGPRLKKIDLQTGVVEELADVTWSAGGTWGSQGDIVFVKDRGKPLMRIPAAGGQPQPVTPVEQAGESEVHMWPSFLPDGRHFVYHVRNYASEEEIGEVRIRSLDGTVSKVLFPSNSSPRYAPPGHLVWWHQGNLRTQRFDVETLSLKGDPVALIADVRFDPRIASTAFSLSDTGILVYQRGGALSGNELVWFDRQGNDLGTVGPAGSLYDPRLSPDGTRIAVDISGETNQGDVWVLDTRRNTVSRLTSAQEDDSCPVWSPDGATLAYCSIHGVDRFSIFGRPARGGGEARILAQHPDGDLDSVDWHENTLLLQTTDSRLGENILSYSLDEEKLTPYLATPFEEEGASFSPDGRHVVYSSDETGRMEVYVQTFPEPGAGWRISVDGGRMPRFSPDGSELFFISPANEFMAVSVRRADGGGELEFGTPQPLFQIDVKQSQSSQWDLIDGERFLFNRNIRSGAGEPLTLVQNWQNALTR